MKTTNGHQPTYLNAKTAIITGAAHGMGRAIATALSRCGANVVIADRDGDAAANVATELSGGEGATLSMKTDVSSAVETEEMVDRTLETFGAVHILINNAGVLRPSRVLEITEEEWDFVVDVNLKGTFLCSKAVLSSMQKEKWGRIVNLSSTAGKNVSTIGGAHYTAAKAGILGFTRHLAKEVAPDGITVNALCPGLIDTEMVRATIPEEKRKSYAASFPIPRLGRCGEVAELALYLCSDAAAYITGASLDINGGDLMI